VSNVVLTNNPNAGSFTVRSSHEVTAATLDGSALFSSPTPDVNGLVTVTMPAGYKALPSAFVVFGSDAQTTISVAADSNSFVFRAHQAGPSGTVSVGNIAYSSLTTVPLNGVEAAGATATVGATVTELAGTNSIATAPTIIVPAAGLTSGIVDAPSSFAGDCSSSTGFPCRFYKIVVGAGGATLDVSMDWNSNADLGLYFLDDTGTTDIFGDFACDANGPNGHPESCTESLDPGTYYLGASSFTSFWVTHGFPTMTDPTSLTITLTGN
jgi:hypothetical protein